MQAYRSLYFARFALLLQYRAAAFAGIVTQLFWGFIKVMVLVAFFSQSTSEQPMTLNEAIGYVWLGQAFIIALVPWSGDREVQELIKSGAVGYDLLRPIDLYNFWLTRALAMRTAPLILRGLPIMATTMLILPLVGLADWMLPAPPSWAALIAFLLSFVAAIVLSAALTMLMTVSMMWTLSGEGVNTIVPTLVIMFSGLVVPLPLFPEWTKPLLNVLPFSGLFDQPLRLFTGNLPVEALPNVLVHQGIWVAILVWFGRFLVSKGIHKLVIQGG